MQSIEYAIRTLETMLQREQQKLHQHESNLAAFAEQIEKPFEHEGRFRELLLKQAELDRALDLHQNDAQAAAIPEMPEQGE